MRGSSQLNRLLNGRSVSWIRRRDPAAAALRCALALLLVGLTTAVLVGLDADLAQAISVLLLAVVSASVLGYAAGIGASLAAFAALNYYFTSPLHTFEVAQTGDLVALVVFIVIALLVGTAFARLIELRLRAQRAEEEALLRLAFIDRLAAGDEPGDVLHSAAGELVALFDLASCEITSGNAGYRAVGDRAATGTRSYAQGTSFRLDVGLGRPLAGGELHTIEALAASLATTLDRIRLDTEAREHRLLRELDQSRAGFLTAVTHDLRTPLATIKAGTAALLVEDSRLTAAERRKVVEVAHDESARLERIITNVLELTRVRGGALRPEPVPVDAADLVRVAVQRLHRLADHRTISIDFDPELPPVWVDPTMLEHVVVNLLENALRYSPGDTPIEVCAVQVAGEQTMQTMQTMQTVQIVDHGSGIAVEDRDRIFDEFVRLDRHRAPSGTGLGLAIVRAFVEANGGDVRCDDTPGGGATFVVTLPNVPGEERA